MKAVIKILSFFFKLAVVCTVSLLVDVMWFHIGCTDVKLFDVTLCRMSSCHHSAWHTPLILIDLVSYSWLCTFCLILVLAVCQ